MVYPQIQYEKFVCQNAGLGFMLYAYFSNFNTIGHTVRFRNLRNFFPFITAFAYGWCYKYIYDLE